MAALRSWLTIAGAVLVTTLSGISPANAQSDARSDATIADQLATVLPSVVNLAVTKYITTPAVPGNIASQPSVKQDKTEASGFIIDPSGLIVTNRHAVANAADVIAILNDGTRLRATLLAAADQSDIALLTVDAGRPLPALAFGDSDRLRPGDGVFAIGNPFGLGGTVTSGIVSALDRNTTESEAGSFIQIDAAINHGNSGGPVVDVNGAVIGIGTALFTTASESGSVGISYAIPSDFARFIVNQLRSDGHAVLGWIGAHVESVTGDIAAAVGRVTPGGSIVLSIDPGSPAALAGLSAGDVILKIGGEPVEEPRILNRIIAESRVGSTVGLTIWRGGALQMVPVVIGQAPPPQVGAQTVIPEGQAPGRVVRDDLGLIVGPVTDNIRHRLGLAATAIGVAVRTVVAHSAAADRGIQAGSLILNIDRLPVLQPPDVQRRIDAARRERRQFVLVLIEDAEGLRWVSLPLELRTEGRK